MNKNRFQGKSGDTQYVAWTAPAWNLSKRFQEIGARLLNKDDLYSLRLVINFLENLAYAYDDTSSAIPAAMNERMR